MRDPDSELDALVRSAAPPAPDAATEDRVFADVWARVQTSMTDGEASPADVLQGRRLDLIADRELAARRRRRATRLASAALAVAVAGGGTAAAAELLSTHTGSPATGINAAAAGTGEILNAGGTDRDQVFDEVTADIPFPPGYEAERQYSLDSYPHESNAEISTQYLRSTVAGDAVCTWADAWVAADDAGDAAARAAAADTLTAAVAWPDIQGMDTHGAITLESGETLSYYHWVPLVAEAARAGDHQAVLDAIAASSFCSYRVLPVIDADPGYEYAGVR